MSDDALQRFFADPLIAVRHKRCGKLVGEYRDGYGWHSDTRCRCDPAAVLPDGAELAALVERARTTERHSSHRARIKVYV